MVSLRGRWATRWFLVLSLGGIAWLACHRGNHLVTGTGTTDEAVDSALMAAGAARMSARRRHLRAACAHLVAHNATAQLANPWEFFVDRKHHLVWCNVFKAASTSWMYNFNLLAGHSPAFLARSKKVPLMLARESYPRPSLQQLQEAVNDSVSFLIVRHPFERLVSAYRDKIEAALPHSPHRRLGEKIVAKFRHPSLLESARSGQRIVPTFAEFVSHVVDAHAHGEPLDMHWTPVASFCTPCSVDFSVLAKFETLPEDQRYLIALAGLQNYIRPEWRNPTRGGATDSHALARFAQLTRAQVHQLYDIYREDFLLFDYTPDDFLAQARNTE